MTPKQNYEGKVELDTKVYKPVIGLRYISPKQTPVSEAEWSNMQNSNAHYIELDLADQDKLDQEHMLEDLYKEVTGSDTKVIILDEPLKDRTVFSLVVPKMATAQDEKDAIKRMFKPIKDSKYASKLIYVYVAPTLAWFYFTNDNVQAVREALKDNPELLAIVEKALS